MRPINMKRVQPVVVLLGLSRGFLLIFKYCTNRSENLHGDRSHQKVVRASAKLKNPISRFRVIKLAKLGLASLWLSQVLQAQ